ncbi:UBX domain-containing protein 6 [Engraulis encrasicolus]|uniref:UBX domain-containing protein 6 n=1 Tax=Engraulis encrasicolus TaxID=184585 RepID=UPI002FD31081
MKKFFEDIKKDVKFKSAGPGKKLTEDSGSSKAQVKQSTAKSQSRHAPTEGAQRAGAAALARIEQQHKPISFTSQDAIRNQVKRELEAEAAATAATPEAPAGPVMESRNLSVPGIYFTCPLTGALLTKAEREPHIKEAILMRFSEDPVVASIMMMHTFNRDQEKVKGAVEIINKYIDNICKNPTEEKYRKIKLSNKIFQERVNCVEGSQEFLQALGFERTELPIDGQDGNEEFLVLAEQDEESLESLKERGEQLRNGEPIRAQLDRQAQAFSPSPYATHFDLPPDFYNLTAEELKKEQQLKSEIVDRNSMLRTKAMRERDEQRERRKYNYALIRVRLPDGILLQGTFLARERVAALYEFVRAALEDGWQPFELMAPGGKKLIEDEDVPLNECNLVPSAVVTFSWDEAVLADIAAAGKAKTSVLNEDLLENIKVLS